MTERRAPSTPSRYELLTPIAAGGMASVWAARLHGASGFAKIVALKTMLPELATEPEYRQMFLDEARLAAKLHHPNVCETLDLGEADGALFMALEWVEGVALHRLLRPAAAERASPLPLAIAVRIVIGACAGLHAAHEATDDDGSALALVHRDVSPQNLIVSKDGEVKVSDFGIAKAKCTIHRTAPGQAKGKLAYMAPEQLRGIGIDRRADVYALGCVLYEITTGKRPFEGETDGDTMKAILRSAPRAPSELVASFPAELSRILGRAMARDPEDRFASAEGLRLALEQWLRSAGVDASSREVARLVEERAGAELAALRTKIRAAFAATALEVPRASADDECPAAGNAEDVRRRRWRGGLYAASVFVVALGAAFFGSVARTPRGPVALGSPPSATSAILLQSFKMPSVIEESDPNEAADGTAETDPPPAAGSATEALRAAAEATDDAETVDRSPPLQLTR